MKTVAVIGASNDRRKFGNKAFRGFLQQGYTTYAVNPNEAEVEGHAAYKTLMDVPGELDLITVYVAPPVLLKLLPAIAQKGCGELWLNPGTESDSVLAEAKRLNLKVVQTCSILAIGLSPSQL
ncbi:MAG: CoA-binding protein [Verrucomicrobiales bacterium]